MIKASWIMVWFLTTLVVNAVGQNIEFTDWRLELEKKEKSGDLMSTLEYLEELDDLGLDSTGEVELKLDVYSELVDELLYDVNLDNEDAGEVVSVQEAGNLQDSNTGESPWEHSIGVLTSYDYDDSKYSSRLLGLELGYALGYSFESAGSYHMLGAGVMGELLRGQTLSSDNQATDTRQVSSSFSLSYTLLSGSWVWLSLLDYSKWDDKADTDTTNVKALLLFQSISQDFYQGEKWKGTWNVFGSYSPDFDDEIGLGLSAQYKTNNLNWKLGAQIKRSFSDRVSYELFEINNESDTVPLISNIEEWVTINPYIDFKYKLGRKHVLRAKASADLEQMTNKDNYLKYMNDEVVWGGSIISGDSAYYPYPSSDGSEVDNYEINNLQFEKSVRILDWYLRLGYDYSMGRSGNAGTLEFRFKYEGQTPLFESKSNPKESQTRYYSSIGYSIDF